MSAGASTAVNGQTNYWCNQIASPPHLLQATNVAGYISWGFHSSLHSDYATNGLVTWSGDSRWWIIETIESNNGQRNSDSGNFLQWFSSNAFGGTDYSNTPVGAVTHVDEPQLPGVNKADIYFGLWASGRSLATCSWESYRPPQGFPLVLQVIGDPLIVK